MCFETTEPERDVWGDNNDNMRTAFMVRIAESDKKSYAGKIGKVRNMITDPKIASACARCTAPPAKRACGSSDRASRETLADMPAIANDRS